jgi:hypothetical protein
MFCHITQNWRGRPLESVETMVSLIGSTTTKTRLRIKAALDSYTYEKAIKFLDEQLANLHFKPHLFRGDWNYALQPAS